MDLNSKVCGLKIVVLEVLKSAFFLKAVSSIVNPVNKLEKNLFSRLQSSTDLFLSGRKRISEQHDTSFLLAKYLYSY